MDIDRKVQKIQTELIAHERECAIRSESVQRQLDSLTARLRRVEAIIMGSTITILLCILTLMWKVLQLPV